MIIVRLNTRHCCCLVVGNCIKVLCGAEIAFGKSKIRVLHFIGALHARCLFIIFNNVLLVQQRADRARASAREGARATVDKLVATKQCIFNAHWPDRGPSNREGVIKFAAARL